MDKLKEIYEKFKALPWKIIGIGVLIILGLGIALDLLGIASIYGLSETQIGLND